jgi:hypothetical protein
MEILIATLFLDGLKIDTRETSRITHQTITPLTMFPKLSIETISSLNYQKKMIISSNDENILNKIKIRNNN